MARAGKKVMQFPQRRPLNCSLSSITEHSFHGIHFLLKKRRKCNLCVRYVLLPMCRVAQRTYILFESWALLVLTANERAGNSK